MTERDVEFAFGLADAENWHVSHEEFTSLVRYRPDAIFICEMDEDPVGIVSAVSYEDFGFIGFLIVHHDHRGKGLGTQLLKHAMNHLQELGNRAIFLEAVGKAIPLYERLGFVRHLKSLRLRLAVNEKTTECVYPMGDEALKSALQLDREHFGADRSYFLKTLYRNNPELCFTLRSDGSIVGFVLGRGRENYVWIGPWIVEPDHLAIAGNLVKRVAREVKGRNLVMGVLESNQDALSVLHESCLVEEFSHSWRMICGDTDELVNSKGELAIGYPAKG